MPQFIAPLTMNIVSTKPGLCCCGCVAVGSHGNYVNYVGIVEIVEYQHLSFLFYNITFVFCLLIFMMVCILHLCACSLRFVSVYVVSVYLSFGINQLAGHIKYLVNPFWLNIRIQDLSKRRLCVTTCNNHNLPEFVSK